MTTKQTAVWIALLFSLGAAGCGGGAGTLSHPVEPIVPVASVLTIGPNPANVFLGSSVQLYATMSGSNAAVAWALAPPSGWVGDAGSISTSGLYVTPYPAPASLTVVATSTVDSTKTASVILTINPSPSAVGPSLTIDLSLPRHAINPLIYGMNAYQQDPAIARQLALPLNRWGGDSATRYNYKLDVTNSASDWWYETNPNNNTAYPDTSDFNSQVEQDMKTGTKTLGTMPLIGWTTYPRTFACSFSVKKYGAQKETDQNHADCGKGKKPDGNTNITGNDPTDTSVAIDENWTSAWVTYLVGKFGKASDGGISIYDLDNEPEWWSAVHRDVHPLAFTYDEITQKGLTYAKAIKDADPTAEVSGPAISDWQAYFYSMKDISTGWATGPCHCYNGIPSDRLAHGDVPMIEYYLQQFKAYEDTYGRRLLDYVDIHTYFAPQNVAFALAGSVVLQKSRLDSTRVFWDPTYTSDPQFTDPDDRPASGKVVAPQVIPRMKQWVAKDYPGTKLAIPEYNWGGQEAINGALAQADILGIFGREGLDIGALWGTPDLTNADITKRQIPSLTAFLVYRNYDGVTLPTSSSQFGDTSVSAVSADQGKLAVYAAERSSDGTLTIVIINKTYGDLNSSVALNNTSTANTAKVFVYSNANLNSIAAMPDLAIRPTGTPAGITSSLIMSTFPAQSITLWVIPKA